MLYHAALIGLGQDGVASELAAVIGAIVGLPRFITSRSSSRVTGCPKASCRPPAPGTRECNHGQTPEAAAIVSWSETKRERSAVVRRSRRSNRTGFMQ